MASGNMQEHDRATSTLLVALLLIMVGMAAAAGTYYWQMHKIDDLNKQISTLNTRISNLQRQQSPSSPPSAAPASSDNTYESQKGVQIIVYTPIKNAKVASPVGVVGKVPGNWSYEASFPVQIRDSSNKVVAQGTGQLLGDWMTDNLVPFSAKLTYSSAAPGAGTLVLQKDNPSGQESNDDALQIPIQL